MNAPCGGMTFTLVAILAGITAPQWADGREHETVTQRFGEDLFAGGADVRVSETVPGDALLAGGRITTSGVVRGDAVAAGGHIELGASIDGGLYAAGGRVRLVGKVARNARIAGGDVEIGREAQVQGGLTIGAGEVEVDGRVGKYLLVGAGRTRIDGHVGGDVQVASGELNVGPAAVIDGALTYYGPQPANVASGAQIKGGIQYIEHKHWNHGGRRGFGAAAWFFLIGWIIVGSILLALWPGFSRAVTDLVRQRTGMALLIGFVVLVCAPVAIVLSLITIIGIPLALIGICLYVVMLALGYLASAATLGEWLLARFRTGGEILTQHRLLMFLGVMLALFVLTRIPVLGGALKLLVILAGVGGLAMASMARRREAR